MRGWALLIVASCAAAPTPVTPVHAARPVARATTEPPAARGLPLDWLTPIGGPERPKVVASVEVDTGRLPLAAWGPPDAASFVHFTNGQTNEYHFVIEGVSFGELHVSDFLAYTGNDHATGTWPSCNLAKHVARRLIAEWRGLSIRHWTDDGVDVVMSRGVFDETPCRATATTTLKGRAEAIVPGFVYALRVEDALYVVAPRATLAASTDDAAGSGPFSSALLPVTPSHDATVSLRVSRSSIAAWLHIRSSPGQLAPNETPNDEQLLLTIEVRARGDGHVASVTAALPADANEGIYGDLLDAMRR